MKLAGSVALVVGTDSDVGEAIVQGLIARDAFKVYAASYDSMNHRRHPGAIQLTGDLRRTAQVRALARKLPDVTLLVNCMVVEQRGSSPRSGLEKTTLAQRPPTLGQTLQLIEAFAPVLGANGGGAVVNLLTMLCGAHPKDGAAQEVYGHTADWMLAAAPRARLAAQRTLLLHLRTNLLVGSDDRLGEDRQVLAKYMANRVLVQIEAADHYGRVKS